jgi:Arc/MetJ-type ribon-helix-helix transcriptional regulator
MRLSRVGGRCSASLVALTGGQVTWLENRIDWRCPARDMGRYSFHSAAILVDFVMAQPARIHERNKGLPAVARNTRIVARLPASLLAGIKAYQVANGIQSRSEAIRRLVELGLRKAQPMSRPSTQAASKAADMAAQQIDRMGDLSASAEERHSRKRRLLECPKEFRDLGGRPGGVRKPKGS